MAEQISKALRGSTNGHYGKMWIYSDELKKSIRIIPEELLEYLALGWNPGRRMKF